MKCGNFLSFATVAGALLFSSFSGSAVGGQGPGGGARMTNQFTGPNKCLDIVNDGRNNRLILAQCGNYTGQSWIAFDSDDLEGYGFFKTAFTGPNKCLEADSRTGQVYMTDCASVPGQHWTLSPMNGDRNRVRLQNLGMGPNYCLDVVNDGVNNKVHMAACGNYSGQFWR